jgi:hypothetical protein
METIEKAIETYVKGSSINEAAQKYGVAKTTLQRHLKKRCLTRRYTVKPPSRELVGKKFGNWTVIDSYRTKDRLLWICECKCGRRQKVRRSWLTCGESEQCGDCSMTGESNPHWKGCGKLSGTYWKRLKANAFRRRSGPLSFEISISYAWRIYQKQEEKCALSGLPIPMPEKVEEGFVASLDRIDSKKGYIEGNVQWVHKDLNKMKWDLELHRFIELCKLVAETKGG